MVLTVALVFALWYTWPVSVNPQAAAVAEEYVTANWSYVEWGPALRQSGRFGSYKLSIPGLHGDRTVTALVSVSVTADGARVTGADLVIGASRDLPRSLAQIAMVAGVAILFFFRSIPRTFGRRCPRDRSLLRLEESVVVPQQYSPELVTLPGIIQRTWTCPQCDFQHAQAIPDPRHRPTRWGDPALSSTTAGYIWTAMAESAGTFADGRKAARDRAVSDEQYDAMLREAREAAAGATSIDSPWRRRRAGR